METNKEMISRFDLKIQPELNYFSIYSLNVNLKTRARDGRNQNELLLFLTYGVKYF